MSSAGVSDRPVPPVSAAGSFGVYVHIPFCATRCDYCAFATWTDKHDLIDRYLAAVCGELRTRRDVQPVPTATSVFFGGGTPSLVAADSLMLVLDQIERVDGLAARKESDVMEL